MIEELIKFETAKIAKEKGFDWECEKKWVNNYSGSPLRKWKIEKSSTICFINSQYPAPTQSLLQKWLRDEHKVFIGVNVSNFEYTHFTLQSIFQYEDQVVLNQDVCDKWFDTYEQALEAGLIEALKLIP